MHPPLDQAQGTPLSADISELRKQLADLKESCAIANTDANRWNRIAVERLAEIERLSTQSSPVAHNEPLSSTIGVVLYK